MYLLTKFKLHGFISNRNELDQSISNSKKVFCKKKKKVGNKKKEIKNESN